jgi:hypothetical protein
MIYNFKGPQKIINYSKIIHYKNPQIIKATIKIKNKIFYLIQNDLKIIIKGKNVHIYHYFTYIYDNLLVTGKWHNLSFPLSIITNIKDGIRIEIEEYEIKRYTKKTETLTVLIELFFSDKAIQILESALASQ